MFYCTMLENENPVKCDSTILSEENAQTNLVGCIVIHRESGKLSLSGNVNAFATLYGAKDEKVKTDDMSKQATTTEFFETVSKYGDVGYNMPQKATAAYVRLPRITEPAEKQVYRILLIRLVL